MVNEGVSPFICKLFDYRAHMYDRFKREYLAKHVEKGGLTRSCIEKEKQRADFAAYDQRPYNS